MEQIIPIIGALTHEIWREYAAQLDHNRWMQREILLHGQDIQIMVLQAGFARIEQNHEFLGWVFNLGVAVAQAISRRMLWIGNVVAIRG
jgi:hypothetical protein